jgi:hypothetical protein
MTATEIWSTVLTVLLVAFNGLLALFTYRLFKATTGLWEAAKAQSEDMKRSLQIAADAAEATRVAADAARKSADAATIAANAAKASFVAVNRPKLIVRHVELFPLDAHKPVSIRYMWANIGGTPGHLFESNSTVLLGDELPPIPDYTKGRKDEHAPTKLGTGQFTVTSGQGSEPLLQPQIAGIESGTAKLFLYGYVKYKDDAGTEWLTAFCRRYNPRTKRFEKENDPDYEYVD